MIWLTILKDPKEEKKKSNFVSIGQLGLKMMNFMNQEHTVQNLLITQKTCFLMKKKPEQMRFEG